MIPRAKTKRANFRFVPTKQQRLEKRRDDEFLAVKQWWKERLNSRKALANLHLFRREEDLFGGGFRWPQWVSLDALYKDFLICSKVGVSRGRFVKIFRAVTSASRRSKTVAMKDSNGRIRYYKTKTVYEVGSLLPP